MSDVQAQTLVIALILFVMGIFSLWTMIRGGEWARFQRHLRQGDKWLIRLMLSMPSMIGLMWICWYPIDHAVLALTMVLVPIGYATAILGLIEDETA
ncbi:MAG: hypothetical protein MUF38_01495 [Anaerolineae bacterium]|jgi:hypothetical protein|nr:hypothetical protein [Anaerolineae bacterium]